MKTTLKIIAEFGARVLIHLDFDERRCLRSKGTGITFGDSVSGSIERGGRGRGRRGVVEVVICWLLLFGQTASVHDRPRDPTE